MKRLIVPHMMAGVQAWAQERLGPELSMRADVDAAEPGSIGFWLPDGRVLESRPLDPEIAHFATPMRIVRFQ